MADVQRHVARFTNDSRIPGWDRAADLSKEPAIVPDPATTEVPVELRAAIEDGMRRFPVGDSAFIPALYAVQEHYGWCPPHGIEQAAAVLGRTPAALTAVATFYTCSRWNSSAASRFMSAPTSPARSAAPTNCWRRLKASLVKTPM